jgi:hypothetical protein
MASVVRPELIGSRFQGPLEYQQPTDLARDVPLLARNPALSVLFWDGRLTL